MNTELIIIGNELLQGKIQDKNAYWLAKNLPPQGFKLTKITIIEDDEAEMLKAFQTAWDKSQIVIASGGLGPTRDDLTKEVVAKFFEKKIVESQLALKVTEDNYQRQQRTYLKEKMNYHFFPEDFTPLNNPTGHAPGLAFFNDNKAFFCTPGVPHELQSMVTETIIPLIGEKLKANKFMRRLVTAKTFGVPESQIFTQLCPDLWDKLQALGVVSSLPHLFGVDIGVAIEGHDEKEIEARAKEAVKIISKSAIHQKIWQWGQKSLEEVLLEKMQKKDLTLSLAESCTGGLASSMITDISGSSSVFMGSVVSYSNQLKMTLLNVKEETLKQFGAVSVEVAQEMAKGARKNLDTDFSLAFTGIAGPTGGTKEKPVGTVAIAVDSRHGTISELFHFKGTREVLKQRFAQTGLFMLHQRLEEL